MKKIFGMLAIVLGTIALVGCGDDSNNNNPVYYENSKIEVYSGNLEISINEFIIDKKVVKIDFVDKGDKTSRAYVHYVDGDTNSPYYENSKVKVYYNYGNPFQDEINTFIGSKKVINITTGYYHTTATPITLIHYLD